MAPSAGSGMELKVHVGTSDERLVGGQAQFIFFSQVSVLYHYVHVLGC